MVLEKMSENEGKDVRKRRKISDQLRKEKMSEKEGKYTN